MRPHGWDAGLGLRPRGRALVQHDPRGTDYDLTYTSDQLCRTTAISAVLLTTPITSTYDPLGRRTHLGDESGTTGFTYDALGLVTAVAAPNTGTVGYGYDARGLSTRLTYPDSAAIDDTYYEDGKLSGVWQGATQLAGLGARRPDAAAHARCARAAGPPGQGRPPDHDPARDAREGRAR